MRLTLREIARLCVLGWAQLRQEWTINGTAGVEYFLARRIAVDPLRRLAARHFPLGPFRKIADPFAEIEALASAGCLTAAINLAHARLGQIEQASPRSVDRRRHRWSLLADLLVVAGRQAEAEAIYRRILAVRPDDQAARFGIENLERRRDPAPPSSPPPLPAHFFTIVLNGMPFIEHHIEEMLKLPFDWHWHIVEGVAALTHDTSWSRRQGGRADASLHRAGLSLDGTAEYLDQLATRHPEHVTLYRSPKQVWGGKIEMVRAPLARIREECLLWEIDVDEFWTADQITRMRQRFTDDPSRTAAYFLCHYFIKNLVITTANTYGNHPTYEWLRVWRYRPGDYWATHEPPRLCRRSGERGIGKDLATVNPFLHAETLRDDLVFRHLAYVLPEQLRFKEIYYGYKDALKQWEALPQRGPLRLRDLLSWITDAASADDCRRYEIVSPMPGRNDDRLVAAVSAPPSTLFRSPRSDLSLRDFRNILVIKLDNIGDAVLLSPFLRELRRNAPDARITLVVRDIIHPLIALCPHVDRTVPVAAEHWGQSFSARDEEFLAAYERKAFDLALVPRWDVDEFGAGAMAQRSGAARVVGFSEGSCQKKARENAGYDRHYTDAMLKVSADHAVTQNLALLTFLNGTIENDKLEAWVGDEDVARAEQMIAPCGDGRLIAVCPGASHPGKVFPAEGLVRMLGGLPSSYRFVLLGDSADRVPARLLQNAFGNRALTLCGATSLREAAAIIQRCAATITMDSAPAHFAAAADKPVVLFSMHPRQGGDDTLDQSPARFGPWCSADRRLIIQPELPWPGCEKGCRWRSVGPHCIGNIDIEASARAMGGFLARHVP